MPTTSVKGKGVIIVCIYKQGQIQNFRGRANFKMYEISDFSLFKVLYLNVAWVIIYVPPPSPASNSNIECIVLLFISFYFIWWGEGKGPRDQLLLEVLTWDPKWSPGPLDQPSKMLFLNLTNFSTDDAHNWGCNIYHSKNSDLSAADQTKCIITVNTIPTHYIKLYVTCCHNQV